jgi:hypothetical protein
MKATLGIHYSIVCYACVYQVDDAIIWSFPIQLGYCIPPWIGNGGLSKDVHEGWNEERWVLKDVWMVSVYFWL